MVITLVAPAVVKRFATNFAPIGALGLSFLSCLARPKYGRTTVIFFAEALLAASIIRRSSKRLSAGGNVEPIKKTLPPLTDWSKTGSNSPSLNS